MTSLERCAAVVITAFCISSLKFILLTN
jgi:hypothetical protein